MMARPGKPCGISTISALELDLNSIERLAALSFSLGDRGYQNDDVAPAIKYKKTRRILRRACLFTCKPFLSAAKAACNNLI